MAIRPPPARRPVVVRPLRFSEHRLPGRRQAAAAALAGREQVSGNRRSPRARPLATEGEGGKRGPPSLPPSLP